MTHKRDFTGSESQAEKKIEYWRERAERAEKENKKLRNEMVEINFDRFTGAQVWQSTAHALAAELESVEVEQNELQGILQEWITAQDEIKAEQEKHPGGRSGVPLMKLLEAQDKARAYLQCHREDMNNFESNKEQMELLQLVYKASGEMKNKLLAKQKEGYTGWDNPENEQMIFNSLKEHIDKALEDPNQWIDVANLAIMLWNFER